MSELATTLQNLNTTLQSTAAVLTRVKVEQASLLDAIADLTDKLAAAVAAGSAVPPEVLAAMQTAVATAAAVKAQADAIDVLVPDAPAAP